MACSAEHGEGAALRCMACRAERSQTNVLPRNKDQMLFGISQTDRVAFIRAASETLKADYTDTRKRKACSSHAILYGSADPRQWAYVITSTCALSKLCAATPQQLPAAGPPAHVFIPWCRGTALTHRNQVLCHTHSAGGPAADKAASHGQPHQKRCVCFVTCLVVAMLPWHRSTP